jgi:hypothetical protein
MNCLHKGHDPVAWYPNMMLTGTDTAKMRNSGKVIGQKGKATAKTTQENDVIKDIITFLISPNGRRTAEGGLQ